MSDENETEAQTPDVIRSGDRSLTDLAGRANEHHRKAEEAARRALAHARDAGRALIEVKDRLPYGEWGDWLEENFEATHQTANNYMRIARRWPELMEAEEDSENAFSIRRAVAYLAGAPDEEQGRVVEVGGETARDRLEDALDRLPEEEQERARDLLVRLDVSALEAVRTARTLADSPPKKRKRLYEFSESGDPDLQREADVQLGLEKLAGINIGRLPRVAHGERIILIEESEAPTFEGWRVEQARPVLALQALLRWAVMYCDRPRTVERVIEGLWVARDPEKIVEDARAVAERLTEIADAVEEAGEQPFPGEGGTERSPPPGAGPGT